MDKAIRVSSTIHWAKGAFVPGLAGGRIPGQRHTKTAEKTSNNLSGARKKSVFLTLPKNEMYKDLKSLLDDPDRDVTRMFIQKDLLELNDLLD